MDLKEVVATSAVGVIIGLTIILIGKNAVESMILNVGFSCVQHPSAYVTDEADEKPSQHTVKSAVKLLLAI